jgi:hypothetical protein
MSDLPWSTYIELIGLQTILAYNLYGCVKKRITASTANALVEEKFEFNICIWWSHNFQKNCRNNYQNIK